MVAQQFKGINCCISLVVVFSFMFSSTFAQLPAPTSINISDETSTGFNVSFSRVEDADFYQITVFAFYNVSDATTYNEASTNVAVTERRSNIIYKVVVRATNGTLGNPAEATARTAPAGVSILHLIPKPTFVTVFLEETPGATGWQIQYSNSATNETSTLDVPKDTPSNTHYVAIISSLNPNTRYLVSARVAQFDAVVNYTESQSPYGRTTSFDTEKLSAFARVDLLTRNYTSSDNTNVTLRETIANELELAYQANSDEVFSVSVVELEEAQSENILCHHEIVLNVQSLSPNVSALVLSDRTLYNNTLVMFKASNRSLGFEFSVSSSDNNVYDLSFRDPDSEEICEPNEEAKNTKLWSLHDKSGRLNMQDVTGVLNPTSPIRYFFTDKEIQLDSFPDRETLFNLSSNTIYGIEQTYLLKTCTSNDNDVTIYDRVHGAFAPDTSPDSSRYTIFHNTDGSVLDTSAIQYTTNDDGVGVTLLLPSSFLPRAIEFTFNFNETTVVTLTRNQLDSSSTYMVEINGLNPEAGSNISMIARRMTSDGTTVTLSGSMVVITDINECARTNRPHDCHPNASCENTVGGFNCTCNDGFSGNGTTCRDINECITNEGVCASNSTCNNTIGSFNCICDKGFQKNGVLCVDLDECDTSDYNCTSNSTCNNTIGSFNCICDEGFQKNGVLCVDLDECATSEDNCTSNSTCNNTISSFNCICDEGFQKNGVLCVDLDECATSEDNCTSNSTCNNTIGSFNCICDEGFRKNGVLCVDIDECATSDDNCTSNSTCNNTIGSFNCICDEGFQSDGALCKDIDECAMNITNCSSNSTCYNTMGSFICRPTVDVPVYPPSLAWIAGPILLLVVILVAVVVLLVREYRRRDRQGNYNLEEARLRSLTTPNEPDNVMEEESFSSPTADHTGHYDVHAAEVRSGMRTDEGVNHANNSNANEADRTRTTNEYVNTAFLAEDKIETDNDGRSSLGYSSASPSEDRS